MKVKKRKLNISFKEMFGLGANKAQSALHSCPCLHINSFGEITVENCNSILLYTENEICFDMKKLSARIKGDNIVMDTMEKNMVTVHGRIFNIEFLYNKE